MGGNAGKGGSSCRNCLIFNNLIRDLLNNDSDGKLLNI